jgi:hypothetical protein
MQDDPSAKEAPLFDGFATIGVKLLSPTGSE